MAKRKSTGASRELLHSAGVLLLLAALLGACTAESPTVPLDTVGLEARALAAEQAGDRAAAAALYERLARSSAPSARSGYLITAARLHIASSELAAARRALTAAAETATVSEHSEMTALNAEIDLGQGNPEASLDALATIPDTSDLSLLAAIASTRGRALFALGRFEEAVRVLTEREVWLNTGPEILANQELIWNGLARYPAGSAPAPTGDRIVDGWLALAPIASAASDPAALKRALIEWRERFPEHPAAGGFLADLLATRRGAQDFPSEIALLLPLSSAQQAAAAAIRDGFVAAYLQDGPRDVRISVYDTALLGGSEAYLKAQLEGADFIVGPLLRPDVEQVAQQVGFVPTLALNFLPSESPAGRSFFQFALSPEDEAREVAQHAAARGAATALALVPSNELGRRLLASFRSEFEQLGGKILAVGTYDPGARDFSLPITTLLNLDGSTQRYQRLAANLRMPLEFEPRRRADADMLFLAASPSVGRLIAPQLRFYYAGDIPTYATSDIYETGNASADNDLNGLYFPDASWLLDSDGDSTRLKQAVRNYWPQRSQWLRFFGMGFDAYKLIPMLYRQTPATVMQGLSGELELDAAGQVHRRLPLAQFRDGRPVEIEAEPPLGFARRE
jgi:uncharacterized protein